MEGMEYWMLLLKCCFTSTQTVGLLGTGAQDVHLDFHTAPELWNSGTEGMEYVSVFNLKMPSGIHVIVKDLYRLPFMTAVLYVLYLSVFKQT